MKILTACYVQSKARRRMVGVSTGTENRMSRSGTYLTSFPSGDRPQFPADSRCRKYEKCWNIPT